MRSLSALVVAAISLPGCLPVRPAAEQTETGGARERRKTQIPADMVRVEPVRRTTGTPRAVEAGTPPTAELRIGNGRFFSYALPPGWRVGEDGQFALTLLAPDNKALTVMVGNAGLPPGYPPAQFVYEKLSAIRPENLQLGPPRPSAAAQGFQRAFAFEVRYSIGGVPCRGVAKCHITTAYDTAVMAMTAALSEARQWDNYASWLPQVSEQISASNGAAFGMRGIMAQNLQNSAAYAQAAREYRDWSQKNWQQVTDGRNASQDRRNAEFRENLGAVQSYNNPYDSRVPLELPTKHQYYWVDRQGNVLGTDNPGSDPNVGSTGEWKRMERVPR